MIENLQDILTRSLLPNTEAIIAEEQGISIEEAKATMRDMSFSDYVRMQEASVDMRRPTTPGASPQAAATLAKPYNSASHSQGDAIAFTNQAGEEENATFNMMTGNDVEIETDDGQRLVVSKDALLDPSKLKNLSIRDRITQALTNIGASGAWKNGKAKADASKVTMNSSEDHDEIRRLQELAGIDETSTAGGTSAGGIASVPSVIGDTSHPPTVKLRAKNRRKKEKKK